jgi:hypothetical protein
MFEKLFIIRACFEIQESAFFRADIHWLSLRDLDQLDVGTRNVRPKAQKKQYNQNIQTGSKRN